jgi:hypothetical protein
MRAAWLLVFVALALAGCGDDSDGELPSDDEDAVLRVIEKSNDSFAEGDYSRTCSYYSAEIQRELAARAGTCPQAWAGLHRALRRSLSPPELEALTDYDAESAEIDGDRATAKYGEPPEEVRHLFDAALVPVELHKIDGRWVITTLPAGLGPSSLV